MSPKKQRPPVSSTASFEKLLKDTHENARYVLRLYITGTTQRSAAAIANLRNLCDEYLPNRYDLEVIDIYQQPKVASLEQIIAAPTLVKEFPNPPKRLIGDLSDRNKVLVGLDLSHEEGKPANSSKGVTKSAKTAKTKWVKM